MNDDGRIVNAMIAAMFCERDQSRYDLTTPRVIGDLVYATDGRRAVRMEVSAVRLNMFPEHRLESAENFPRIANAFDEKRDEFDIGKWKRLENVRDLDFNSSSYVCDGVACQSFDGVLIQDRFVLPLYFAAGCEFRALPSMVLFRWSGCRAMIMRYGQ